MRMACVGELERALNFVYAIILLFFSSFSYYLFFQCSRFGSEGGYARRNRERER